MSAFKDKLGVVHSVKSRYDHPCSFPDGMATLKAPCGRRVEHHDKDWNRIVEAGVDCMACLAAGEGS